MIFFCTSLCCRLASIRPGWLSRGRESRVCAQFFFSLDSSHQQVGWHRLFDFNQLNRERKDREQVLKKVSCVTNEEVGESKFSSIFDYKIRKKKVYIGEWIQTQRAQIQRVSEQMCKMNGWKRAFARANFVSHPTETRVNFWS